MNRANCLHILQVDKKTATNHTTGHFPKKKIHKILIILINPDNSKRIVNFRYETSTRSISYRKCIIPTVRYIVLALNDIFSIRSGLPAIYKLFARQLVL